MSTLERTLDDPAPGLERGEPSDALVGISRGRTYIPEAESVRGIAVALVASFHLDRVVRFFAPPSEPTLINAWMLAGHAGVDLFFLLSGFLLSLPFLADGLGGPRVSVTTYARRRALRILPLYYVVVVVGTMLAAPRNLWDGLPYLFFLNGFPGMAEPLGYFSAVWWSLAPRCSSMPSCHSCSSCARPGDERSGPHSCWRTEWRTSRWCAAGSTPGASWGR